MVVHIHSVRTEQSRAIDSNDVGSGATLKKGEYWDYRMLHSQMLRSRLHEGGR
jgi:hypothetical protein